MDQLQFDYTASSPNLSLSSTYPPMGTQACISPSQKYSWPINSAPMIRGWTGCFHKPVRRRITRPQSIPFMRRYSSLPVLAPDVSSSTLRSASVAYCAWRFRSGVSDRHIRTMDKAGRNGECSFDKSHLEHPHLPVLTPRSWWTFADLRQGSGVSPSVDSPCVLSARHAWTQ